jgi:hypothetical protein
MDKIKIAFDPKTGLYMALDSDLRSAYRKILVDGEQIENPFRSSTVVLKGKPSKIEHISTGRNFVGWENTKSGELISQEDHSVLLNEITKKGELDDEEYTWSFEEVEDHVEFLRFEKTWVRKYTEEPITKQMEIEIIEHPVSDIPEITPSFNLGSNSIFDTICTYSLNSADLFRKRCEHFGITKAKTENEKGNVYWLEDRYKDFRFAKLGGNYCSSDELNRSVRTTARGTYEELKKLHESNVEKIDNIIKDWISKQDKTKIDPITLGKEISFLSSLMERVRKMEVKKVDHPSQRSIVASISSRLEDLKGSLN